MRNISIISFFVWLVCYTAFLFLGQSSLIGNNNPTHILLLIGVSSFGLFWLMSIAWALEGKMSVDRAFRLPALSVLIVLCSIFLFSKPPQTTAPISQKPSITTTPTPTPTPAPKAVKKVTQTPKIECVGPDGVHFQTTQKECDSFNAAWNNTPKPQPTQTTNSQPSHNYDYYVPSYNYQPSSYYYVPNYSYPSSSTYTPSYPTANITVKPMPTIGASTPIQNNCETYTTNGGSTTICK